MNLCTLQTLPRRPDRLHWQEDVQLLHKLVCGDVRSAVDVLSEDDSDPVRLRFHSSRILSRTLPTLDVIGAEMEGYRYTVWFNNACRILEDVYLALENMADKRDSE